MKIESLVRLMAGSLVLLGVALAHFVSPWWLLLPVFVGANLAQSALTGFCPPSLILGRLGWLDGEGVIHWGGTKQEEGKPS
jgi:hypothetical protein